MNDLDEGVFHVDLFDTAKYSLMLMIIICKSNIFHTRGNHSSATGREPENGVHGERLIIAKPLSPTGDIDRNGLATDCKSYLQLKNRASAMRLKVPVGSGLLSCFLS